MTPVLWVLVGVLIAVAAVVICLVEFIGYGIKALARAECPDVTDPMDDFPAHALDPLTP